MKSWEYQSKKLVEIQQKYKIRRKEDWYRLPRTTEEIDLVSALQFIHPTSSWSIHQFVTRNKKTHQRLLHLHITTMYPHFLLLENYRHPYLYGDRNHLYELDLFFPPLNIAIEYQGVLSLNLKHVFSFPFLPPSLILNQFNYYYIMILGEQHYEEILQAFNPNELYRYRDNIKLQMCQLFNIQVIFIPYWWDLSISSLPHLSKFIHPQN